ncbi:exopolyphosphatase [Bacteroides xylanisolvens]|nr:exopolyphosphatase [Bacteroides xylanisolvens]
MKQYKLKPDRADVLVPAAEIFLEIATHIKATGIIVPTIRLFDGIINSLYTQNMNKV